MTEPIISIVIIALFAASTFGWGRLLTRALYGTTLRSWPYSIVLGVASWIFIGGLLNATGLAYPAALYILTGLGLSFCLRLVYTAGRSVSVRSCLEFLPRIHFAPRFKADAIVRLLPLLMILAAFTFLVATLMPTNAFNFHDDFHTYFVRLARMLQTGTLRGNSFDVLGIDSLGAQTFLQSFVPLRFSMKYLNGFDAVFCFTLSAFLLVEIARRLEVHRGLLILALLAFVVINPQYVNTSALYSGTMLILALILASCILTESQAAPNIRSVVVKVIPIGLLLSCLVSLKVTFMFFAIFYFLAYFGFSLLFSPNRKQVATTGGICCMISTVALLPWIVVHVPNYIIALKLALAGGTQESSLESLPVSASGNLGKLLSFDELYWGGTYFDYNYIVALLVVASLLSLYFLWTSQNRGGNQHLAPLLASCTAAIASYFASAYFVEPATAVRYSCPVLIAVLPAAVMMLGQHCRTPQATLRAGIETASRTNYLVFTIVASQIILMVLFSDVFLQRVKRAYNLRTLVSFHIGKPYLQYNKQALSLDAKNWARHAQSETKQGSTILAWMSVPFYLDFSRNRVLTVTGPGLTNPWLNIPTGFSQVVVQNYLRRWGVQYVIWEYKGFGMKSNSTLKSYLSSPYPMYRKIGEYNLHFRKMLRSLAQSSEIIYDNGQVVVFDINKGQDSVEN